MTTTLTARAELIDNLRADYIYEMRRAWEALERAEFLLKNGDTEMANAWFKHYANNRYDAGIAEGRLRELGAEL